MARSIHPSDSKGGRRKEEGREELPPITSDVLHTTRPLPPMYPSTNKAYSSLQHTRYASTDPPHYKPWSPLFLAWNTLNTKVQMRTASLPLPFSYFYSVGSVGITCKCRLAPRRQCCLDREWRSPHLLSVRPATGCAGQGIAPGQ